MNYLVDIPQDLEEKGLCKTFMVRHEVIHWKHIMTEIFAKKSIDMSILDKVGYTLVDYMENMTHRLRHIHHFSRGYRNNISEIIQADRNRFFPTIELYGGLNNIIVLDFDGVCTSNYFQKELYERCVNACKTVICTANPQVTEEWFIKKGLTLPHKIYACKGKAKKMKALVQLQNRYDNVFYVDNEQEYLEFAWVFGIKTYIYKDKIIRRFTKKTT